jgi:hypothetical protein
VSPGGGSPEDFRDLIAKEIHNWTEIARAADIKAIGEQP